METPLFTVRLSSIVTDLRVAVPALKVPDVPKSILPVCIVAVLISPDVIDPPTERSELNTAVPPTETEPSTSSLFVVSVC